MVAPTVRIILLAFSVGLIWYLIRMLIFDGANIKSYQYETVEELKTLDLDEVKTILDDAYVKANLILAKSESAKSILELEKGIQYLKEAIKQRNVLAGVDPKLLPKVQLPQMESIKDPGEVCPEKYGGSKEDYPFYLKNIPLDPKCKVPPIYKVATVIFNFVNEIPIEKAATLIEDAAFGMYRNMSYIAYLPAGKVSKKLKDLGAAKLPNLKILERKTSDDDKTSHAALLKEMVSEATTKYVVIARNTERFDNFSTIERMVRDISLGKVFAIGGSHRNNSGHWKAGCYQFKIQSGEMQFDEGYDLSDNGCMFCDYISGPFATTKDLFLEYLGNLVSMNNDNTNKLYADFLYMDFFMHIRLKMRKKVSVCFDAMYYTETTGLQTFTKSKWLPFVSKHSLSKVTLPDLSAIEFTCDEASTDCSPQKDKTLSPCCINQAEEVLKLLTETLTQNKIAFRFCLPGGLDPLWKKLYSADASKNIFLINVDDPASIQSILKKDDFIWDTEGENSIWASKMWKLVFHRSAKDDDASHINVRFGKLWLPVVGNPGKALNTYGRDTCTKDNVCFNILREYGNLGSQKIWM